MGYPYLHILTGGGIIRVLGELRPMMKGEILAPVKTSAAASSGSFAAS